MKSLFIRCSEETYDLAHALAKKESRSLNKQIIHMIHSLAEEKNVEPKKVESCLLKNVKVVHLDYENDSMFEVMDKIATVSKGIRFDTIGILEHGKSPRNFGKCRDSRKKCS